MSININSDRILRAIKENPQSVLVVALFLIAMLFAYLFHSERLRISANCDEQIQKFQTELTTSQIECNEEFIRIRKECRNKIDSIEDKYYAMFHKQELQIDRIQYELETLQNKIQK